MLRPCRCSGSVSYVHLDCLNTWRATSTAAYFTCSVCKYNYRIERTAVAALLMRESFVAFFAAMMIVVLCFVLGGAISAAIQYADAEFDPVVKLFEIMNVDNFWLRCNIPRDPASGKSMTFLTVLYNYLSKSAGVIQGIKAFIFFMRTPLPMVFFVCHPAVLAVARVFLLGAMPIGAGGFFGYIIGEIMIMSVEL